MTTLIFGSAGFIGATLTESLARGGEPVICFDVDALDTDDETVTSITGDVTDYAAVEDAVGTYEPDRVVNLAYVLGAESDQSPERAVRVNCVGMDNVLRAAVAGGVDRVVYASSIAAYGPPDAHPGSIREGDASPAAHTAYPLLFYSATKQLNEYQVRLYADRSEGATGVVAVRPSIVFGPGREGGLTQWASDVVTRPARDESVHLPFRPEQPLDLVYRDDVAALIRELLAAEAPAHDAYNTGGITVTARELADAVTDEVGGSVTFDGDADPIPLVADVSHERAAAEFGYDVTPLREAIRRHAEEVR